MSTMSVPNFAAARSWKWVVGIVYIVLAIVLLILGRTLSAEWFAFAVLFGIGVILV
jgi:hypothetical protein